MGRKMVAQGKAASKGQRRWVKEDIALTGGKSHRKTLVQN